MIFFIIQIKAVWLGDFKSTTYITNFNSKYILTPDWRASLNPETTRQHEQVRVRHSFIFSSSKVL